MIRFYAENQATVVELSAGAEVPAGTAWHQIGVSNPLGNEGRATIEVDDGSGLRLYATIDLTKADRVPYCMVLEADKVRITPDRALTICYRAEPWGLR
jgi:hypothetical protein